MQRLSLKWILLRDRTLIGLVQDAFPKVKVLLWEDTEWGRLIAVDIVGFNGPFDEIHKPLPFGSLYVWDWGPHHHWPGWVFSYETIQHFNCGGVSDFQGSVTIGSLASDLILPVNFHVESPLGDLGSILESKAGGQEFSTAPIL